MNKIESAWLSTHTNVKDFCGQHKNLRVAARKNFHCIIRARVATVPCGAHSSPSFFLLVIYALCTFFTEAATPEEREGRGREGGREGPSWHTKLATCLLPWLISFSRAKWCCPDRVTPSRYSRRINCPWHQVRKDSRVPHCPFALISLSTPLG